MSQEAAYTTPKEDCIAFETVSIVVPSLESLTDAEGKPKPLSSPVHKIGGLAWRMEVHKVMVENKASLDLHVFCNEEVKDHLWLCKVLFKVHCSYSHSSATYSSNHFYGFYTYYWILLDIFNRNNIIPYPENSPIEIKLDIKICHISQKNLPALDTSMLVNMGEGKSETLLVNKHVMATFSSYFRNLFFEDWNDKKERGGKCFELNESDSFDMEAFKFMIYATMTMGWMVHESNFLDGSISVEIVKLAIKYDFAVMLEYCEKYLMDAKDYSKMDLLELADQYGLIQLKEHCLNEIGMLVYMEDFSKEEGVHSRLNKATREQLRTKLGEKAEGLREIALGLESDVHEDKPKPDLVNRSKKLTNALLGKK